MRIRDFRAKIGISQKDAADYLGVTKEDFLDIEHNKIVPTEEELKKLEELFQTSSGLIDCKRNYIWRKKTKQLF